MEIRGTSTDGAVSVQFDTDVEEPALAVAEAVGELKGVDATELTPIYDCIDHLVDHLFTNPPDPAANAELSFDYEGYRITVRQDGHATFESTLG
jgi:hypothetical protein